MTEQEKTFYAAYTKGMLTRCANGNWDADAFVQSKYGQELAERYKLLFRFEPDSSCSECTDYYKTFGVCRQLHDDGQYFERWSLLYPEDLIPGRKYPLVVMNHGVGGSLENDELGAAYGRICGKEKFFVLHPQNTNTDSVLKILDYLFNNYPIDRERLYISGHSQGGRQASSFVVENPELVAAFALSGNDAFRNGSVSGRLYTDEEFAHMKDVFIPCMMLAGQYEYGNLLPLNRWEDPPANRWTASGMKIHIETPKRDPRRDAEHDPTDPPGVKRFNPAPPADATPEEKNRWKIGMLNKRLDLLNIPPRDEDICLSYIDNPDTELHKVLGIYGDRERIEYHYGYRHYMVDIYSRDGIDAFRYCGVENSPHRTTLMHGKLTWDFFKQFRRDAATGKIIVEPYSP